MLRPKKNPYKEFDNEKASASAIELEVNGVVIGL